MNLRTRYRIVGIEVMGLGAFLLFILLLQLLEYGWNQIVEKFGWVYVIIGLTLILVGNPLAEPTNAGIVAILLVHTHTLKLDALLQLHTNSEAHLQFVDVKFRCNTRNGMPASIAPMRGPIKYTSMLLQWPEDRAGPMLLAGLNEAPVKCPINKIRVKSVPPTSAACFIGR